MTIVFSINGKEVKLSPGPDPNTRLVHILRELLVLTGTRCGCLSGRCCNCVVILNGRLTPSCLIPAFRVRGCEVVAIEGLKNDFPGNYIDIETGFKQAGAHICEACAPAKMLLAETLLEKKKLPPHEEIARAFSAIRCRCSGVDSLASGVEAASRIRERRRYGE